MTPTDHSTHATPADREPKKDVTSVTAHQLHEDIEQTLETRAQPPETRVGRIEERLKGGAQALWDVMKRHPFVSFAALTVIGSATAAAVGAAELAFGGALALAAYKVLREGEPPMKALEEFERAFLG
jgi:hypothetical protein